MATTLKKIAKEWLTDHGFDGLCSDDCFCRLDNLLNCWNETAEHCEAGYLAIHKAGEKQPYPDAHLWHIQTKKPTETETQKGSSNETRQNSS